jgi:signal transduction histidine kinase
MEAILFFSIQIVFMSLHLYYTERKRREVEARIKIANSLDQQRQMAEKLIEMEENEKQRIARNIHDEIGSLFAAIKYRVLSISQKTVLPDVQEDLEQLVMLSNHGIEKQYSVVDEMVFEVNRDKSLERAIQEKFTLLFSKLPVVFHFEMKMNQDQLSEVKKIQLYRILSELLTNTLKHASATNIYIRLNASNRIEVHYSDDGRGFDYTLAYGGMGLVNIQNRVNFLKGTLTIESNSSGSLFLITIPL